MLAWHTCVGLRYGPTCRPQQAFRGRAVNGLPDRMPSPLRDGGVYHPDLSWTGVLLASTYVAGGGILTACPSATPLGLALGPD